jgi:ligand-binding sensor domain-containing protein/two-component sensor histidine kinase
MIQRARSWLWLFLCGLWAIPTLAQRFDLKTYSVGEGLAQSQVFALLEDSRGYLWMGTRGGGLSRFDGETFRAHNTRDGLINNYLLALHEAPDGRLWIGTDQGLSIFDGQRFHNHRLSDTLPLAVHAIAVRHDSLAWLGTDRGLLQLLGDTVQWVSLPGPHPHAAVTTLLTQGDSLWVGHAAGLSLWHSNQWQHFDHRQGLPRASITALQTGPEGELWVGTYGAGLYQQRRERFDPMREVSRDEIIFDLYLDSEQHLWVATLASGALRLGLRDSSRLTLDESDGLPTNHVRALCPDRWGTLWLGTSGGGVSKYYGQQFIHQDQRDGLPARQVYALTEDVDCRLWIGAGREGLAWHDGQRWRLLADSVAFPRVKVKALLRDRSGQLWAGTEGQGLWTEVDARWINLNGQNGLSGNWVRDLVQDPAGYLWIATAGGGITRLARQPDTLDADSVPRPRWQSRFWTTRTGLAQDRINALHCDRRNRIWYATDERGIGYLDAKRRRPVNLPLPGGPSSNAVRVMVEDAYGYLWIGTAGGGIVRLPLYAEEPLAEAVVYKQRLTSANLYLLIFDEQGQLWIGSETGLDRATLDPDRQIIDIRHFGYGEGFLGVEVCRDAALKDHAGNLWFGTVDGLTQYIPRSGQGESRPPVLSLEEVSLFYTPLEQTAYADRVGPWRRIEGEIRLPHRQNHLNFDFAGVNLDRPQAVRYQWRLIGFEADWSPISRKSDATYSNLPPGRYQFRVRAANDDQRWSEPLTVGPFVIEPPYWQRWWFIAAVGLLLTLLLGLIFKLRLDRVRREARQAQQQLEMEKHLLEVEQKALRLQMNPHFIFNALNSIQALIGAQDTQTARYYLAKFSRLMRMVLENSRESRILLSAEIEMLSDYLSLERFSRGNTFAFEIETAPELDPEEVEIPPLLIQPFVENAIIHGVAHLSGQGKITVQFDQEEQALRCVVRDNGIGRAQAAQLTSQHGHHQKSTALRVIQERLDLLPDPEGQASSLEIVDLVAADGSPAGTEVRVRIVM